ncbi:sensor histidine kinase [Pedobacter sp. SL55]|uniref:sensor histidine kinase n=1 Tax=Pedobacter sp. SL55 TaxID=2995161 RepID=UPI00226E969F|nr:histidine kinase [Pedobacter sp. SL55]WAC40086.1 histidine kinase [Pedobacter sp. SL55]
MALTLKKIIQHRIVKHNIKYIGIGILVGISISLLIAGLNSKGISARQTFFNILFSVFISLGISNTFSLLQRYSGKFTRHFWQFILLYYVCNILGMIIGIEICYLIISFFYDVSYQPFNHAQDYRSISVIVLIVGTIMLLYHLQKRNAENVLKAKEADLIRLNQLKTQAELQALQSKINPHFLYNALNAITSLIHEDPDKAEDMTIKLSKLFRYSINSQHENFCSLQEEIEILNTYLAIEKVRFGDRIHFNLQIDENLGNVQFPRFLLQPLVENALKHGLKNTYENGILAVKIYKTHNEITVWVADNGIPFPEELIAGYGLQSTFDKLKLLYPEKHEIEMINQPEKHIKITIPLTL